MPITLTAGTSVEGTTSVTSTTVTLPPGLVDGDYTIIVVSLNATTGTITTPGGWTNILASTQATASTSDVLAIFYRKWVSGDTNPAVTTTSGRVAATPIKVSGANPTTFVDVAATVTQASAGATTITAPTITPGDDCLICVFNARNGTSGGFVTPWSNLSASMTSVAEASGKATAATNAGHLIATETVAPGTATGTRQANPVSASTGAMGVSFSLREAAAPSHAVQSTSYHPGRRPGIPAGSRIRQTLGYTEPEQGGGGTPGVLALDASTPALANASALAVTTATFTPPAGALLVTSFTGSAGSQADPTVAITDNAGANVDPWTEIARATVDTTGTTSPPIGGGVAVMHWAKVVTSGSMTVTATQTAGSAPSYLQVWVITGADTTTPIGDTDIGFTTNNTMVTGSMTTTRDVSWIAATASEWSASGTAGPNHPDLDIGTYGYDDTVDILVGAGGAKEVPTSGTAVTATIDGAGTAAKEWLWAAAEIRRDPGGGGAPVDYDKTVDDTLGATDAVESVQDNVRDQADTAGLTDAIAIEQGRTVADPIGGLDSVTAVQDNVRTVADTAGLTDSATAVQENVRTIADTAGLTDSVTALLSKDMFVNDALGATDAVTSVQAMDRVVSDTAGITDSATRVVDSVRSQADTAGLSDATFAEIGYNREVSDTLGITDAIELSRAVFISLADLLGATDAVSATATEPSETSVSDQMGLVDAIHIERIVVVDLADIAGLTDVATPQMDLVRWPQDTASIADTVEIIQGLIRILNESSALADTVTQEIGYNRPPADTAGVTDAVTATMGMVREVDDLAGLSDAIQTIMDRPRALADTVRMTDSVVAVLTLGSLHGYVFDAVPLATRWTVAALDPRWTYVAQTPRFKASELLDRYETKPLAVRWATALIPGETVATVDILVTAGAAKFVGGTITEKTGKDISGATFEISLGSETNPGRTWLTPTSSVAGATNSERIVKYLVTSAAPAGLPVPGQYWAWVRVADTPEIEPLRVQGPINVR